MIRDHCLRISRKFLNTIVRPENSVRLDGSVVKLFIVELISISTQEGLSIIKSLDFNVDFFVDRRCYVHLLDTAATANATQHAAANTTNGA